MCRVLGFRVPIDQTGCCFWSAASISAGIGPRINSQPRVIVGHHACLRHTRSCESKVTLPVRSTPTPPLKYCRAPGTRRPVAERDKTWTEQNDTEFGTGAGFLSRINRNTVETAITYCAQAISVSLSPCGRGPGRGGQGSTNRLVCGRAITPLPTLSRKGRGRINDRPPIGLRPFQRSFDLTIDPAG